MLSYPLTAVQLKYNPGPLLLQMSRGFTFLRHNGYPISCFHGFCLKNGVISI